MSNCYYSLLDYCNSVVSWVTWPLNELAKSSAFVNFKKYSSLSRTKVDISLYSSYSFYAYNSPLIVTPCSFCYCDSYAILFYSFSTCSYMFWFDSSSSCFSLIASDSFPCIITLSLSNLFSISCLNNAFSFFNLFTCSYISLLSAIPPTTTWLTLITTASSFLRVSTLICDSISSTRLRSKASCCSLSTRSC